MGHPPAPVAALAGVRGVHLSVTLRAGNVPEMHARDAPAGTLAHIGGRHQERLQWVWALLSLEPC